MRGQGGEPQRLGVARSEQMSQHFRQRLLHNVYNSLVVEEGAVVLGVEYRHLDRRCDGLH